jgi:hypothetical protein
MKNFFEIVIKFFRFFITAILGLFIGLNSQFFLFLTKNGILSTMLFFSVIFSVYILLKNMIEF